MSKKQSILDILSDDNDIINENPTKENAYIEYIPEHCINCEINVICSVLPTILSLSNIGITLEVKKCQYHAPIKE